MNEIMPGLHHWQAFNSHIDHDVDSYHVALEPPVVIDPMLPQEGSNGLPGGVKALEVGVLYPEETALRRWLE